MNEIENIHFRIHLFYFFDSCVTLNENFATAYGGVMPKTPQEIQNSKFYTPKRDDKYPRPFHLRVPPHLPGKALKRLARWY